jgi:hypothetical protein
VSFQALHDGAGLGVRAKEYGKFGGIMRSISLLGKLIIVMVLLPEHMEEISVQRHLVRQSRDPSQKRPPCDGRAFPCRGAPNWRQMSNLTPCASGNSAE